MRPEDLIPAFLDAAEELRLSREDRKVVRLLRAELAYLEAHPPAIDPFDDMGDRLSDLFDLLDRYTPDYCYFGAHPGDGADYGVWIVEDLLQDTRQGGYDGCVFRADTPPYPVGALADLPFDYSHWLHVNDHGNCTLYRRAGRRWVECWSVV